ncbi:MAG: hypothetical protein WCP73_08175, partial [Eubacteriales bacterium]
MNELEQGNKLARNFGFWSSLLVAVCSAAFLAAMIVTSVSMPLDMNWTGMQNYHFNELQVLLFSIPDCILAPAFLAAFGSMSFLSRGKGKFLTQMAVIFTVVYVAQITINYYLQMTAVRYTMLGGDTTGFTPFSFGNPHSIFWSTETIGYAFLCIAMLFLVPSFKGKSNALIRWILILNGVLGVAAPFMEVCNFQIPGPPIGLLLFGVTMPI